MLILLSTLSLQVIDLGSVVHTGAVTLKVDFCTITVISSWTRTREEYARCWAKKENVKVDTLSDVVKSISEILKEFEDLNTLSMFIRHESIFSDHEVIVPAEKRFQQIYICPQKV